jgi:hypothetical protein
MHTRHLLPLGLLLSGAVLLASGLTFAAPLPSATTDVIKERAGFIPYRQYFGLPGKTVGIVVSNVQAMMGQEGRGGPPDAYGFSANLGSYRWMYVPVDANPLISNLQVEVGEKGGAKRNYPSLSMINPQTLKRWDITGPYALVEVEVNDGLGAPAQEGFVATKMRRLDGTKEYPLQVAEAIATATKRYQQYKEGENKAIEGAMQEAGQKALKDKKPTGPRETSELMYVTWLTEGDRLRVHFRTTISDGAYQTGGGGQDPVQPNPRGLPAKPALAFPPPPPPPIRPIAFKFGTSFGVEFGMAYEFSKSGKLDRTLTLPYQSFQKEIPPLPYNPPRLIDRLPTPAER